MRLGRPATTLTAALLLTSFALAAPASAQTATNLQCKGCVGKKDLGKNAVRSKNIKKKSVKPSHLTGAAKPTGVDFATSDTLLPLTDNSASLISTTITAPGPGFVVAMASWYFYTGANTIQGRCYLATAPGTEDGPAQIANSEDGTGTYLNPAALIRTIAVSAGNTTVHLNCRKIGLDMRVASPSLNALFVPNRY